jgi:hypothetical protein
MAEMVTDDKSGKKLPPHSSGEWVFSRTINVAGETHLRGGVNCAQVLANVVKDGFQHWPELESDCPPNRRPLGRQLCLPISPTQRKTRAPSSSRLPTLPQPRTRFRARFLLRPSLRRKSPAPMGTDAGPATRCGTGAHERAACPNNSGGARFHSVGHSTWLRRPLGPCANQPPIASHIRFRNAVGSRECAATWR